VNLTRKGQLFETVDRPVQEYGVFYFNTGYNISDRFYDVQILEGDCKTPSDDFPLFYVNETLSEHYNDLNITFLFNQSRIQEGELWRNTQTGGDINFCVRVTLYLDPEFSRKVNFHNTRYKIEVDLLSEFMEELELYRMNATDGGTQYIDYDESLISYQCDDEWNEIDTVEIYSQGSYAQICIETVSESSFEINTVKDVLVKRADDSSKTYQYVADFIDSPLAKTICQYQNTRIARCMVQLQLISSFFEEENGVELEMTGTVKLDFLGFRGLHNRKLSIDAPLNFRARHHPHAVYNNMEEDDSSSTTSNIDIISLSRNLDSLSNELSTMFNQKILLEPKNTISFAEDDENAARTSSGGLSKAMLILIGGIWLLSWQSVF